MNTVVAGGMAAGRASSRVRDALGGVLIAFLCIPFFWLISVLHRSQGGAADFLALPPKFQLLAAVLFALPIAGLWLVRYWLRLPARPPSGG